MGISLHLRAVNQGISLRRHLPNQPLTARVSLQLKTLNPDDCSPPTGEKHNELTCQDQTVIFTMISAASSYRGPRKKAPDKNMQWLSPATAQILKAEGLGVLPCKVGLITTVNLTVGLGMGLGLQPLNKHPSGCLPQGVRIS